MNIIAVFRKNRLLQIIAKRVRREQFKRAKMLRDLKNDNSCRRLLYLSEIDHGNLGDHAIIYAMHKILKDEEIKYKVYRFDRKYCLAAIDLIAKNAKNDDLIIIPGGGWIGTLWKDSGRLFTDSLEYFKNCHIIVFPQTITFGSNKYDCKEEKRLFEAISGCQNLDLLVRDKASYEFLMKRMPKANDSIRYGLYPDVVLSLDERMPVKRGKNILFVTRKDKEKAIIESNVLQMKTSLRKKGFNIEYTDTVLPRHVSPQYREQALKEKWKLFQSASLVVTDRLHGMIFSYITGTPCIAFDNVNHKVSGTYNEWLSSCPFITCIDNRIEPKHIVDIVYELIESEYSNETLRHSLDCYFHNLKESVLGQNG